MSAIIDRLNLLPCMRQGAPTTWAKTLTRGCLQRSARVRPGTAVPVASHKDVLLDHA